MSTLPLHKEAEKGTGLTLVYYDKKKKKPKYAVAGN
jgi:hypothetical protein